VHDHQPIRHTKSALSGKLTAGEIAFGRLIVQIKRSDAYSAEQVLLNKQQIWCGRAYLHCCLAFFQPNQHRGWTSLDSTHQI